MDISTAKYTAGITGSNINVKVTTSDSKEFWVPLDPTNTDYQEILAWVDEGNTAEDAD